MILSIVNEFYYFYKRPKIVVKFLIKIVLNKLLSFLFVVFVASSCNKKEIGPQFEKNSQLEGYKILILNEGNFGFGNATISAYNPFTKEFSNNSYISENNTQIGDVLQSGIKYQGNYYFVLNNSGKVVITDTINLKYQAQIIGLNSPRYMAIKNDKGYISDLKEKAVYVVDLSTYQIIKKIKTNGWTEQMVFHGDDLYVADRGDYLTNTGNNRIYKINTLTNQITDSLFVSKDPESMVIDKDNKLWVLCTGGINDELPKLIKINLASFSIENEFVFSSVNESPTKLCVDGEGDRLYFINNNVYSMSIYDNTLPANSFVESNGKVFYGLSIDKSNNQIYITDALDYIQQGKVYRYYENGNLIDSFTTGIIPQHIIF